MEKLRLWYLIHATGLWKPHRVGVETLVFHLWEREMRKGEGWWYPWPLVKRINVHQGSTILIKKKVLKMIFYFILWSSIISAPSTFCFFVLILCLLCFMCTEVGTWEQADMKMKKIRSIRKLKKVCIHAIMKYILMKWLCNKLYSKILKCKVLKRLILHLESQWKVLDKGLILQFRLNSIFGPLTNLVFSFWSHKF
jgi:hypothetical protein